jgi:hypothetical protein
VGHRESPGGYGVESGDGLGGGFHAPLLHEDLSEGLFVLGFLEVDDGGDGSVDGVEDELFDGGGAFGFGLGFGGWQVGACDLEAVEEQAGAPGVERVGGEAGEDFGDGELDGGAVFEVSHEEGFLPGAAVAEVFHRAAILVVKIAEIFFLECGRAAAAAGSEDVTALEAWIGSGGHAWVPPG